MPTTKPVSATARRTASSPGRGPSPSTRPACAHSVCTMRVRRQLRPGERDHPGRPTDGARQTLHCRRASGSSWARQPGGGGSGSGSSAKTDVDHQQDQVVLALHVPVERHRGQVRARWRPGASTAPPMPSASAIRIAARAIRSRVQLARLARPRRPDGRRLAAGGSGRDARRPRPAAAHDGADARHRPDQPLLAQGGEHLGGGGDGHAPLLGDLPGRRHPVARRRARRSRSAGGSRPRSAPTASTLRHRLPACTSTPCVLQATSGPAG